MAIGNYGHIGSEVVIPLSGRFMQANLIMPGQARPAIQDGEWFEAGNVPFVALRPAAQRAAVVDPKSNDPQPREIQMSDFFKGGSYLG